MIASNRHVAFSETTFIALDAFVTTYRHRTGKELSLYALRSDSHQLRAAVEDAITRHEPDLYLAAERLVLAIRDAPFPLAA